MQPFRSFRQRGRSGETVRSGGWDQIAEDVRLSQARFAGPCQLYYEQPLVDDMIETVDDAGAIEVEAGRGIVVEGVEAGARCEDVPTGFDAMTAERFEQRVPGRNPFQVVRLCRVPVGREPGVTCQEVRKTPVGVALVPLQGGRRPARLERMP